MTQDIIGLQGLLLIFICTHVKTLYRNFPIFNFYSIYPLCILVKYYTKYELSTYHPYLLIYSLKMTNWSSFKFYVSDVNNINPYKYYVVKDFQYHCHISVLNIPSLVIKDYPTCVVLVNRRYIFVFNKKTIRKDLSKFLMCYFYVKYLNKQEWV